MTDTLDIRRWKEVQPVQTGTGLTSKVQLPRIPGVFKGCFLIFPGTADGIRYKVVEVISREPEGPLVKVAFAPRTMAEVMGEPVRRLA